jgi:hypothetical protein
MAEEEAFWAGPVLPLGTHFTCFTSRKVQILTPEERRRPAGEVSTALLFCMLLTSLLVAYTSKGGEVCQSVYLLY